MPSLLRQTARSIRHTYRKGEWEREYLARRPRFSNAVSQEIGDEMAAHGMSSPFGTFIYTTQNVGDEIQTVAQLGFIPDGQDVRAVNRDHVAEYEGPRRTFIMNGWFSHEWWLWPPSDDVAPIFYSFHIARDALADPKHAAYYRSQGPIGCRDVSTVEKLQRIGVDAYFSGCCTLTLQNPHPESERGEQVVIADAHLSNSGEYPPPASDLLEKFVPEEVRREATYVEHEVKPRDATNYRGKTQTALDRLDLYARAKLVITSRLHVALPCLALGTPVVFLNRLWETDPRFEGYRDIIPGYGPDDDEVNVDWDRPVPKDISAFRDQVVGGLAQKVREHVGLL